MQFSVHGFNQIEVMKINQELGKEVLINRIKADILKKSKNNPKIKIEEELQNELNNKFRTDDIVMSNGKTRKRPEPKLPKIGNDELLILNWFVKFYGTKKMVKIEIDNKQYAWVNYSKVLEELPILDINKTNLYNIFINLVDFKILIHNTSKSSEGIYSVYGFGENFDRLIYNEEVKETLLNDKNEGLLKSIEGSIEINRTKEHIINNHIINKDINTINSINNDNSQNLQIDNLEESKNIIEKPKKEITIRQKNAIERTKILEEFIKDEDDDIKKAIKDYVEIRRKKGLEPKQLQIILEDFEKIYKNKSKTAILEQIRKATAGGWMQLVYIDTFKGTPKSSYSSKSGYKDNTQPVRIYHITDEEFDKLSFEDKMKEMDKFDAVADMTKKQKEFYNEYCLARDENGNLLKF